MKEYLVEKDHTANILIGVQSTLADGSWSSWGAWSECSSRCGRGHRMRSRSCTNPPPRFGGRDCPGDYVVRSECNSRRDCPGSHSREKDKDETAPLSGTWSPWSVWSECGIDCRKHRQRWCTSSTVSSQAHHTHRLQGSREDVGHSQRYAATSCTGRDHVSVNCTGGMCRPNVQNIHQQLGPEGGYNGLSNNYLQEQGSISSQEQGTFSYKLCLLHL